MVRGDLLGPETLSEEMGQALRHPASVHEDERGAVLEHVGGDAVDNLAELLGRGHGRQLGLGQLDAHVETPGMPAVHDGRGHRGSGPTEQARRLLDGALRGRQADALRSATELEMLESLERDGQVRSPLVTGQGVDLVHYDRLHVAQDGPAALGGDEEVQALGCGHQERRWGLHHGGAGPRRGVAGAHRHRDGGNGQSQFARHLGDLGQGTLEVLVDVDGQGLERRHVDHPHHGAQVLAPLRGPIGGVDGDEEAGQGLARAGGRGDQGVGALGDTRPPLLLGRGGAGREAAGEPGGDGGMEPVEPGVPGRVGRRLGGEHRDHSITSV